eukprot:1146916-Pelagomonas_calceolata.AAC.9
MRALKVRAFTACREDPCPSPPSVFLCFSLTCTDACAQSEGIHSMPRSPRPSPPPVILYHVAHTHECMCSK